MKKLIYFFTMILSFLALYNVIYAQENEEMFVAYKMTHEEFIDFIEYPNVEKFQMINSYREYYIESVYKDIKYREYNNGIIIPYRAFEKRIISTPVYPILFEYLNNSNKLQSYLKENNIESEITDIKLFYCDLPYQFYIPPTFYVQTVDENYFITLNEFLMENSDIISKYASEQDYYKCIYTEDEYRKIHQLKNAEIIIDGNKLSDDKIKYQTRNIFIPLRAVLETLGCDIVWNEQERIAKIIYNGNEFDMWLVTPRIFSFKGYTDAWGLLNKDYRMMDNRIVTYLYELENILDFIMLNADVSLDRDKYILNITTKSGETMQQKEEYLPDEFVYAE